jgi:hypothetical protein
VEIAGRLNLLAKLCQEINWFAWIRFNRVVELERTQKKPEIDAEIEWDAFKENSVTLGAEDGVKVLSEKMGSDEHFQNYSVGPESILINLAI